MADVVVSSYSNSTASNFSNPSSSCRHLTTSVGHKDDVKNGCKKSLVNPLASTKNITNIRTAYGGKVVNEITLKNDGEDEENDESDDDDDDKEYFNKTFPNDKHLPNNFRERKVRLSSLRVDAVLSAGLNISRSKIDDYFLGSKLKLNDGKVLKKSLKVKEGDCIDLTTATEDGAKVTKNSASNLDNAADCDEPQKLRNKRVRIVKVLDKDSKTKKYTLYLRSWKAGIV
ncbi:hypothetical protein HELRODRAFT_183456 [Helobdella robusta]|uniref:Mitochondrial transcription rescue factor 1 C-terminal domain-containing protein n=1 Tax=Helobdella robusta TaxID=6412 RepID=T1FJP5_HELRO|nr:hypothetical protein HELRODRAFT_183456 [Helobdella robusta]ESO11141.1 hypothetical protein HELRODRAFT_183456 [Helobdella robusta]